MMRLTLLGLFLLATAVQAQTSPAVQNPSVRERFEALVKEYQAEQAKLDSEINKVAGEERKKLVARSQERWKEFAGKIYAIVEEHPQDPIAVDAIFWIVEHSYRGQVHEKAEARAKELVLELPVKDLIRRFRSMSGLRTALVIAALDRARKHADDPQTIDILVWAANTGANLPAAVDVLLEKHPDHPALEEVVRSISIYHPTAEKVLKKVFDESHRPTIKAYAAISLGQLLARRSESMAGKPQEADRVVEEGEKILIRVIELLGRDNEALSREARIELTALRNVPNLRIGKPAPEITAADLDGKEFKLSDYRGKVVLLDFWGDW